MPRNLLARVLVAELAIASCWSAPAPPIHGPKHAPPYAQAPPSAACLETGERLVLVVCRHDHDLAWTVTNATDVELWVFVAPPSIYAGEVARENAFVAAQNGKVVLHKFQLPEKTPESVMSGAIALAPHASDSGVVPLGTDLVPQARNFWGMPKPVGQRITSVVLVVGFAERRATDRPIPPANNQPFFRFLAFDRARQELVRSPELSWL